MPQARKGQQGPRSPRRGISVVIYVASGNVKKPTARRVYPTTDNPLSWKATQRLYRSARYTAIRNGEQLILIPTKRRDQKIALKAKPIGSLHARIAAALWQYVTAGRNPEVVVIIEELKPTNH
ncbi:hypothetical protein KKB83_04785 [Patescibacteria group bacterium]|nr:hypothetical protein [Patescibacteria group bacterium]